MRKIFLLFIIIFTTLEILPQSFSVKGSIRDNADNNELVGANIAIKPVREGAQTYYTTSNINGYFEMNNIPQGRYLIEITFIGYDSYQDTVRPRQRSVVEFNISLKRSFIELEQVDVTAKAITAEQKGDTIQFNARAFKVNPDANAEDLITKIPGLVREGGVVKAQGEDVKQVLVDGKPFFGDDPNIALRNLPADLIEKIQIFDKLSDQSQFTGFDDGNTSKTINIITRADRRTGQFGKLYGGYGTNDRFTSGGNVNYFNSDTKISVIGLGNNVNLQNFSQQDLIGLSGGSSRSRGGGGGGRGGMGGGFRPGGDVGNFLVGAQDGNTDTYSLGLNYMDEWVDYLRVSGSYFFNLSNVDNDQILKRNYFTESSFGQLYNESSLSNKDNYNHRFDARIEYTIDSSNSFIFTPRFSYQDNRSTERVFGTNLNDSLIAISGTKYNYQSSSNAFNFSNELLYRHKFDLPGRTLSTNISTSVNNRNSPFDIISENQYFLSGGIEFLDQNTDQFVNSYSLSSNINYTEPLTEESQLQLNVAGSLSKNSSDKKTYNINPISNLHDLLDPLLSNEYDNDYVRFIPGISYRIRSEEMNFNAGLSYQHSSLKGEQIYPYYYQVKKEYNNLLWNARFSYRFTQTNNIRMNYNTNVNAPSISQLQNTIDNSNPLYLRTGNQFLNEEFTHRLFTRYMQTDLSNGSNLFTLLFLSYTKNYIGTKTIVAKNDTTFQGYQINKGTQISFPVNLDYSFSARTMLNYGFPVNFISSNLNLNASYNYSLTPSLFNENLNYNQNHGFGAGFNLSSNISEKIDFRVSYSPTYNFSRNDIQSSLNTDYLVHTASGFVNLIFFDDYFIRNDLAYYYNTGLSADVNRAFYLWNVGIGMYIFSDKSGVLKFEINDVLNQNESLNKTISETYIEEKSNRVLRQYFLLTFTYNLKIFGGGSPPPERDDRHGPNRHW
ncbi:MAG: TonB-dependent receptor [Ignavibacteriaceae bacterium]|nr:TonB-dependent receptor [Ignavibacteriaceae bacterium]